MDMERFERIKSHEGFDSFVTEKRIDPLNDKPIEVTKIVCKDPLAIGGRPGRHNPRHHPRRLPHESSARPFRIATPKFGNPKSSITNHTSTTSNCLPGMIYEVKDNNLVPVVVESAQENLTKIRQLFKDCTEEEREYAEMWAQLLEYPAPQFRRAAIDIEVYSPLTNRVPDAT